MSLTASSPERHPVRDAKSVKSYTLFKAQDPETPMALVGSWKPCPVQWHIPTWAKHEIFPLGVFWRVHFRSRFIHSLFNTDRTPDQISQETDRYSYKRFQKYKGRFQGLSQRFHYKTHSLAYKRGKPRPKGVPGTKGTGFTGWSLWKDLKGLTGSETVAFYGCEKDNNNWEVSGFSDL